MRSLFIILQLLFLAGTAYANPSGINLSGKISLQATNTALVATDVDFKVRVLSPDGCILYSEKFTNVDLSATAGVFNLTIGNGQALFNAWDATLGTANSKASLLKVFSNGSVAIPSGLATYPGENCAGGAYTPADGDVRKVVIEFDPTGQDINGNYVALSPFHRIRSVPYAMLADHATDSDKLGGVAANLYAKTADIPAAVAAAEADPTVEAWGKTPITGLTGGNCGAGKVLTFNGTSLECVTDGGGGGGGSLATNTVAGTVLVDAGSNVSLNLGTGALDVKDLAISKITGLQTALDGKIPFTAMPDPGCAAGEALSWSSITDLFTCYAITIDAAHVSDFATAVDARIAADTTKLPVAGGTMTGNINMGNQQLSNVGYVHLQNKAADPAGLVAGNEGFVWYNSTDKLIKYYDGAAIKAMPGYSGTCATGEVLKFNGTAWACAADAGSGGADASSIRGVTVNATAPTAGQFMKYVGTEWVATSMPVCTADQVMIFNGTGVATCTAISGLTNSAIAVAAAIDRSKLAGGTINHVLINDGTGAMSSEAQLSVTRGGTGQSTYTDGQLLIGNSTGNTLTKATLTQGAGITITNGNGTITIAADATGNITDDSIVNADINTAAAIDRSKLANGTANRVVVNNGSGVMSDAAAITANRALISDANGIPTHSTVTNTELAYVSGVTSAIQAQLDALTTGAGAKVSKAGDTMTGNLVMNAESEVRFADNNSDHYVALKSPATVAADVTFTLPAADGTAGYVLKTDGSGNLDWVAPAAAPGDASYAAKGVVQFLTDATVSGISVTNGVANVNTGTGAGQIVKLPTAGTLPALNGSALTNLDVGAITSGAGKYFTYAPNGAACTNGEILKKTNNGWECAPDAGSGGADADTIKGAAVSGTVPTEGAFMKYTTGAWTPVFMPSCGADDTLTFDMTGAAACTPIATLTDSAIAAGAAIARTKLANGTAGHVLINDGSGVMSSEAQLAVSRGGTGQSSYTDGQLLIGNSTGNTLSKATLTQGSGITITNGNGTITIAADATSNIADDSIVNADINTAAAIDRSKLANGTANRLVVNDGSGVMSDAAAITANRALISDANGIPTHSAVTNTELGYVSGVTSGIQAQLDALTTAAGDKVAKAGDTMTGNLVLNTQHAVRFADADSDHYIGLRSPATVTGDVTFTLPATDGTLNQVLKTDGAGNLGWVALPAGTVDASYAAKGVVQLDTDLATSGLAVSSGVIKVNTGTGLNEILKFTVAGTLPALNGAALTNLDVAAITSASGKYFSYKPDGTECADGEILKWVAATDRWVCGTAADLGAITSVVAGTGVDVNTVGGAATVSVEAELGGLNGLSTTGYVQRTGAATYSTTAGNTLNSNSTVVTRDGSGVSGFSGVLLNNAAMNVTQTAPAAGTSYTVTWPAAAPVSNGQILSSTTAGVMSWVDAATGTGDFKADGTVAMTGAFRATDGAWNTPSITFANNTNTGFSNNSGSITIAASGARALDISSTGIQGSSTYSPLMRLGTGANNTPATPTYSFNGDSNTGMYSSGADTLNFSTNGTDALVIGSTGNVGIGTTPGAKLDVKGAIRMSGATSGYTGFQPAAVAGSTVWTLPAADGSTDQVLKTDGSGNLGWIALPAGTVDASYAAKGVVQLDTNLATSGLAVSSGVIKVNTGLGADQIVQLPTAGTLPILNGSALTNLDVAAVTSASGKYFSYKPDNTECADGGILKWVAATDRWVCGTAADLGAITSVVAGTGLDVNTVSGAATVSVEAELGALNALATTGYVQRTGAATYSTTAGNTLNSNSTVVTRDGSGVSGFSGVILNNSSMNVTQVAPAAGTSYSVTWPAAAATSNGQILSSTTGGVMSWIDAPTGTGDFKADGTVAMTGALRHLAGTAALPGMTFVSDTNTGISAATADTMIMSTNGVQRMIMDPNGNVGIGTVAPTGAFDVQGGTAAAGIKGKDIKLVAQTGGSGGAAGGDIYITPGDGGGGWQPGKVMIDTSGSTNVALQVTRAGSDGYTGSSASKNGPSTNTLLYNSWNVDANSALLGFSVNNGNSRNQAAYVGAVSVTGSGSYNPALVFGQSTGAATYSESMRLDPSGNLGIGTMAPGAKLDVKGAIRMSGSTSGYTGFQPAAAAGSTVWTLPSADGSNGHVLQTNGSGVLSWVAQGTPGDASYAAKGVVQFDASEATSGMTVASGVASVKRTTAALASTILQLDASSKAMVKGLDLKGTTNSVTLAPDSSTAAYTLTLPPAAPASNGKFLSTTTAGVMSWVDAPAVDSAAITDGSIVNADINASAAIARTKLASGSNNHVLINDGSGVMSSEAQLAVSRGGTGAASFTANSLVISGATSTSPLAALSCSVGQVPFYNGTTYACSTDFVAAAVSSAVNYVLLTGSTGSSTVKVSAAGTGTNLDLTLAAKGTGTVKTDSTLNVNGTYIERAPATTSLSGTSTGTNTLPVDRNLYRVTMTANTTLYLPACPAATDTSFSMTVKVAQGGSGGYALAWGSNGGSVTWDSGTVPDASTATTTAVSIYQFLCFAGESNVWYGMQVWKQ